MTHVFSHRDVCDVCGRTKEEILNSRTPPECRPVTRDAVEMLADAVDRLAMQQGFPMPRLLRDSWTRYYREALV